ncbi:hypothetical protein TgHK011_006104 [Trichoderma gracile]|nr:hypothetical protein TgHK011_006104 [Trichoderma gracile]
MMPRRLAESPELAWGRWGAEASGGTATCRHLSRIEARADAGQSYLLTIHHSTSMIKANVTVQAAAAARLAASHMSGGDRGPCPKEVPAT